MSDSSGGAASPGLTIEHDSLLPSTIEHTFGALCRLDAGWRVLRDRRIAADGMQYRIHFIILHRDYGVGLIVLTRSEEMIPELAVGVTRSWLRRCGFERQFRGFLPIVCVVLNPNDAQTAPGKIASAFGAVPAIGVRDGGWVEWTSNAFAALAQPTAANGAGASKPAAGHEAAARRDRLRRRRTRRLAAAAILLTAAAAGAGLLAAQLGHQPPSASIGVELPQASLAVVKPATAAIPLPRPVEAGRLMSEGQTAAYLGMDVAEFRRKHVLLWASSFPDPEPITGNYDKAAIDRWLDLRRQKKPAEE